MIKLFPGVTGSPLSDKVLVPVSLGRGIKNARISFQYSVPHSTVAVELRDMLNEFAGMVKRSPLATATPEVNSPHARRLPLVAASKSPQALTVPQLPVATGNDNGSALTAALVP